MAGQDETELVRKAITCNLSNCFNWLSVEVSTRVRNNPDLKGLTPVGIKQEIREYVRNSGEIRQVAETRPEYKDDYDYYYKIIMPVDVLSRPLFVEMRLDGSDPDFPVVYIVNAHLQR